MPFLFPALASAACDIGILYLGRRNYLIQQEYHHPSDGVLVDNFDNVDDEDDTSQRVYHYGYIVCMAAIRLFLLLIPLPYHSFFGKALRCPILYRLFYATTIALVCIHTLMLLMIDPASLSSLLNALASYSNQDIGSGKLHHILVTRSLWVALILTLVSTLSHIALFFHVRSTAPVDGEWLGGRRRPKVLLYYAKEKKQHNHHSNGEQDKEHTERESLLRNSSGIVDDDDYDLEIMKKSSDDLASFGRNSIHSSSGRALSEISNKLMMEIQVRLRKAKGEWTNKLEEYQKKVARVGGSTTSNPDLQHHHIPLTLNNHLAPFRVILELFAGDDNNDFHSNNDHSTISRLDAVYDRDDGAALMLFVPQLLSFLLHGAYESSHPLEEWILETCSKNLFFAHKCYWFLRAWSLETTSISISQGSSEGDLLSPRQVTRLSHSSSLTSFATQEDDPQNVSKLLPEERAVIEDLMRKIMKCGEAPARLLHFGSTVGKGYSKPKIPAPGTVTKLSSESSTTSTSLFRSDSSSISSSFDVFQNYSTSSLTPSSAVESGLIPVNPLTGVPSQRHFECLIAHQRYGFLPLDNGATLSASYNQSILNGNPCGTSYFDSCTVFLDALITIADNLFQVPRHLRKIEFKKQLQLLEVEALPCNEIYIPLQNLHHRVWRIVSEESIPLSTKERVPCIVCLEVLEYDTESESVDRDISKLLRRRSSGSVISRQGTTASERELVDNWRNKPRDPFRRETTFNRMTHGMTKIPDKMKVSMHEMQASMQQMQESFRNNLSNIRDSADSGQSKDHSDGNNIINGGDNLIEKRLNPMSPPRDAEIGESPTRVEPVTPSKKTQSTSPRTPIAPISQGAMGQWTKSPSSKGTRANTSPANIVEISDEVVEDLTAPSMKAMNRSYLTINANATSNLSRRRISRPSSISTRVSNFDPEINGSYSNDYGYDDEADDCEHHMNGHGNHNGMIAAISSNGGANDNSKPPMTPTKAPPVVFKENWKEKENRLRSISAYGNHPGWKLLPVLIKSNDDLRQEQLASQLIQRMALILARDNIPVWLCPYEILALDANGGIIEAIPDTISIASLKKNDPDYTDLQGFFEQYFSESDTLADARANFCESLAAYSIVCFLLQIKDRHNGNILLDNRGHLIHIDFGFFFLSSPGKNTGFESAPFKLTREFVTVLGGPDSHLFGVFRTLCYRTFLSLRKHCHEIILLVEMLQLGNEDLACFRGRPDDAIRELRKRFRLDLNDRACLEYVNALIDESLENWRTNWYDRYQRYCVGVL